MASILDREISRSILSKAPMERSVLYWVLCVYDNVCVFVYSFVLFFLRDDLQKGSGYRKDLEGK